jgi:hypothetical protein
MKRATVRPVSSGSVRQPGRLLGPRQLEVVRRHTASPAEWLSRVRLNPAASCHDALWPESVGRSAPRHRGREFVDGEAAHTRSKRYTHPQRLRDVTRGSVEPGRDIETTVR